MMRKLLLSLTVLGVFALAFVPTARASNVPVVYNFDSCHITQAGGCGTAPYGTVSLTQNGTSVDVTVTLNSGYSFVKTGSGGFEAFKFVGLANSTSTYGGTLTNGQMSITAGSGPNGEALQVDGPGSYDGDGTGYFAFGISCPTCKSGGAGAFSGPISFTVTNATIAELTVANGLGNLFVADVLAPNGNTGPIDASGTPVPEPASLLLLGLGLAGVGGLRWRRKREDLT